MEHLDIAAALEMIKYFLALLSVITSTFCGIMLWVGRKIDSVKLSINGLNETVATIQTEFTAKHAAHVTEIAVINARMNQFDRRDRAV